MKWETIFGISQLLHMICIKWDTKYHVTTWCKMQIVVWMAYSDSTHFSDKISYKILCILRYGLKDMDLTRFTYLQKLWTKKTKIVRMGRIWAANCYLLRRVERKAGNTGAEAHLWPDLNKNTKKEDLILQVQGFEPRLLGARKWSRTRWLLPRCWFMKARVEFDAVLNARSEQKKRVKKSGFHAAVGVWSLDRIDEDCRYEPLSCCLIFETEKVGILL